MVRLVSNLRNRDAEAKLMENEEGWEVGTWYGHPIYKVKSILIPRTILSDLIRYGQLINYVGGRGHSSSSPIL